MLARSACSGSAAGCSAVSLSTSLVTVAPALLAAALGFGLVSTVAFPLFSTLIPDGEAGGYTALFFSVRAISSAIALPAAGWTVEVTGTYRALFVLGGGATLVALVPLVGVVRPRGRTVSHRDAARRGAGARPARRADRRRTALDEALFRAINGLGPGPEVLWTVLDPHTRNYVVLLILLAVGAAAVTQPRRIPAVFAPRARLRPRRVGPARGRLRGLRPAAAGGGRRRPEPQRPQLGAPELLPERPHGDHGRTRRLRRARVPAPALGALGLRRRRRVHARHVRRPLPARRDRRHGARHRERAARRARGPEGGCRLSSRRRSRC